MQDSFTSEKRIIECVPNFSEGNDMNVIKQITDEIAKVEGVKLLNIDPGKDTNRTVVTFAGEPEQVVIAAFNAIKKAAELIDMRKHKGKHPRMGATDVCPLIPVSGISMEETVIYARKLAEKVGNDLKIPVYCYEYAAFIDERRNLSNCRAGEYEGLPQKLKDPQWKPDFGPSEFNSTAGATAIGARDFLVAYNINLNTTSVRRANAIAFDIREKGRVKREGDPVTGKIVKDEQGNSVYTPGSLKACKAIGWYIKEYGIAQISINLTNINITPIHIAFEEVCKKADERGLRVTGSEIVGLVPLKAILDAGKYFLKKQKRSTGIAENEIIKIAVKSLGLSDIKPFNPDEKIIEYVLKDKNTDKLMDLKCKDFVDETASESPAPGGGSVSALVGTLGVSLGTMVANLSSHKPGWDAKWEYFSDYAEKGQEIKEKLLQLVDEDTIAFNKIMDALALPKNTEDEKKIRAEEIENATLYAIEIPFRVMENAYKSFEIIKTMAFDGNPNSISDAGVAALCASMAISGAYLNVKINASGLKNKSLAEHYIRKGKEIEDDAKNVTNEIISYVNSKIQSFDKN